MHFYYFIFIDAYFIPHLGNPVVIKLQLKNQPDFYVHAVVQNGRGSRIGSRLGVVFNHKKGDGFTLYLDAQHIPLDGQIELVAYPPKS